MRLVSLEAENVKRLKAVRITPQGNMVRIVGRNAQGKTSVLDSIEMLFAGGESIPARPIRDGQKKAKIVGQVDGLIITRKFTPSGSTLEITSEDGAKYPSPQTMLDGLRGKLTFDPLAFCNQKAPQQLETLRKLVGMDFAKLDEERKRLFDERTLVNRQVVQAKARVQPAGTFVGVPDQVTSIQQLLEQQQAIETANRKIDDTEREIANLKQHIQSIEDENRSLQLKIDQNNKTAASYAKRIQTAAEGLAGMKKQDPAGMLAQIRGIDQTNQRVRAKQEDAKARKELAEVEAQSEKLTKQIEDLDLQKQSSLSKAKYPVDGLGLSDNGVTYNGIPFDQASAAEKLRVSAAIGLAMNPKLRVLLIRDGSLLDEESMAQLEDFAQENDAQVWVERVGRVGDVGVVIEDGEVVSDQQEDGPPAL